MLTIRTQTGVEASFVEHPYPLLQKLIKTPFLPLFYMDDVDVVDMVFLKESYTSDEIKTFLGEQVDDYLKTILH